MLGNSDLFPWRAYWAGVLWAPRLSSCVWSAGVAQFLARVSCNWGIEAEPAGARGRGKQKLEYLLPGWAWDNCIHFSSPAKALQASVLPR